MDHEYGHQRRDHAGRRSHGPKVAGGMSDPDAEPETGDTFLTEATKRILKDGSKGGSQPPGTRDDKVIEFEKGADGSERKTGM